MKTNRKIFLLIFLSLFGVLLFSNSTFAYTAVEQKALGYGVFRCYNQAREGNSNTVPAVVGEINLKNVTSYEDIILWNSNSYVPLPTGFSSLHKVTDDSNISCRDLIGGCGDSCFVGLLKKAGINESPDNDAEREKLLTTLGYTPVTAASGRCFKLQNYSMIIAGTKISHETVGVCSRSDKSNATDVYIHGSGNDSLDKIKISDGVLTMSLWVGETSDGVTGYKRAVYDTKTYNLDDFASFDALSNAMVDDFSDHYTKKPGELYCPITSGTISTVGGDFKQICADGSKARDWYDSKDSAEDGIYTIASTRTSDKRLKASFVAISNLLGALSEETEAKEKLLAFSPKEEYDLYKTYFDDYYAATLQCSYGSGQSTTENSLKNDSYHKIDVGALSGCYAKPTKNGNTSVYGLNSDKYFDGTKLDFEKLISAYSKAAEAASISKEDIESGASNAKVDTADNGKSNPCYNAGVEGMSWILCPALNNAANTVDSIEGYLRDWLSIKEDDLFNSRVYEGWNIFRNIANALLTIVLLVVIFSQLTGVGIDNYGIKKMLPRLIMMGILINLSYIMCQLAVELSNILGVGLDNIMKTIGDRIANGNPNAGLGVYEIILRVFALIGVGGVLAGAAAGSGGGVMLVVSLLLVVLVALVAVLMFFLMLGARIMIVAIFSVIAPVAFAMYILPNTQNLFKKWWKVFEAALVVYPICGALYGASYIIKAIVTAGTGDSIGFIEGLIAVVAPFLPFLILPTLLKGAMAGLGALGGVFATLGGGLRKGLSSGKGAIENTKAYKGAQERAADRSAERRARRIRDRLQNAANRRGGINNLSNSQRRRLYQANTLLNEQEKQRIQDSVGVTPLNADATRTRLENERLQQMMEDEIGVVPVDQGLARQRALSRRRSQEIKNYTDQYSTLTRSAMDTELQSAVAAYRADRNEQNSIRLQAAIAAADGRGMNKELLGALGQSGANSLNLSGNDVNDQAILNQLSGSGNKVLNQFAKARTKNNTTSMSLYDFVNNANGDDSLAGVFNSKSPEIMNGMDDDTLSYINNNGGGAGINTETIINATAQTSDVKELAQLNAMLRNRNNVVLSGEQLASYKADTIQAIQQNGGQNIDAILSASDDIAKNPKLISKLDPGTRGMINAIRSQYGKPLI